MSPTPPQHVLDSLVSAAGYDHVASPWPWVFLNTTVWPPAGAGFGETDRSPAWAAIVMVKAAGAAGPGRGRRRRRIVGGPTTAGRQRQSEGAERCDDEQAPHEGYSLKQAWYPGHCTRAVTDALPDSVKVQVRSLSPPLEHAPDQIASRPLVTLRVIDVPAANEAARVLPTLTLIPAGLDVTRSPASARRGHGERRRLTGRIHCERRHPRHAGIARGDGDRCGRSNS